MKGPNSARDATIMDLLCGSTDQLIAITASIKSLNPRERKTVDLLQSIFDRASPVEHTGHSLGGFIDRLNTAGRHSSTGANPTSILCRVSVLINGCISICNQNGLG